MSLIFALTLFWTSLRKTQMFSALIKLCRISVENDFVFVGCPYLPRFTPPRVGTSAIPLTALSQSHVLGILKQTQHGHVCKILGWCMLLNCCLRYLIFCKQFFILLEVVVSFLCQFFWLTFLLELI